MEPKSILDTIINDNVKAEAAVLDSSVILGNFFSGLRDKEREVLTSRFGLQNNRKVTLETIGKQYQLTRERIRQIENTAIAKIKKHEQFDKYAAGLKHIITSLLEEHGGIMEQSYLVEVLGHLSLLAKSDQSIELSVLRNHYDFVLFKLLADEFDQVKENDHYAALWKVKFADTVHVEETLAELLEKLTELKQVLTTAEIIALIKDGKAYIRHADTFAVSNNFDITPVIRSERFKENEDLINEHKALYALLRSSRRVAQNKFGRWGLKQWPEVTPKTINHKIYLVLRQHGEPLHFKDIAGRINDIGFDRKTANPATVHNELILDDKYVLIGRGIYALKEWGYNEGTVAEVVVQVLREADAPLTREDIIKRVLEKRLVKPATVNLALMNHERFRREGGRYVLVGG